MEVWTRNWGAFEMRNGEWVRRGALVLSLAAIAMLQHLTPLDRAHWHYIFPRLYYFPIVFAALYDGWRGGLTVALLSSIAFFQQFLFSEDLYTERLINRYLELISFCTLAVLTGVFTDRERHQKRKYQDLAEKLSGVYETLQTNFEGMKRAERLSAIGHLSAGLAHEVRNPLASIAGAASILRRNQTQEKRARCLDIIESECRRLDKLLTTFLNFARPRSPNLQPVRIEGVLDDIVELARHAVGRKQINLTQSIPSALPMVQCDPEQLRQVLLNLLLNAIEASGDGASVNIVAESADVSLQIRVIDEGSGVAPEDFEKLFDPFFTTKNAGTGLGLPVAHQIVDQMGGQLSARRNADRGMTFFVSLPLAKGVPHDECENPPRR
jgi:two-component system, NtrC family, sensor histidine kinase HydH